MAACAPETAGSASATRRAPEDIGTWAFPAPEDDTAPAPTRAATASTARKRVTAPSPTPGRDPARPSASRARRASAGRRPRRRVASARWPTQPARRSTAFRSAPTSATSGVAPRGTVALTLRSPSRGVESGIHQTFAVFFPNTRVNAVVRGFTHGCTTSCFAAWSIASVGIEALRDDRPRRRGDPGVPLVHEPVGLRPRLAGVARVVRVALVTGEGLAAPARAHRRRPRSPTAWDPSRSPPTACSGGGGRCGARTRAARPPRQSCPPARARPARPARRGRSTRARSIRRSPRTSSSVTMYAVRSEISGPCVRPVRNSAQLCGVDGIRRQRRGHLDVDGLARRGRDRAAAEGDVGLRQAARAERRVRVGGERPRVRPWWRRCLLGAAARGCDESRNEECSREKDGEAPRQQGRHPALIAVRV